MHWDGSISLGNLVTIGAFVLTLYSFHIKNVERFASLEARVSIMWGHLKQRLNIQAEDDE